jgi:phytoene synthase
VHALYGFARYADEIVDDLSSTLSPTEKSDVLRRWSDQLLQDIANGRSHDHIGRALVDTVQRFDIPISYFEAFLHSMAMDLTVTSYEKYEDLMEYVYGSAAVIGLQMVHVLGTVNGKKSDALIPAEKLGIAFQLANFIRDVGEDLERGRVYLPVQD